MAQHHRNLIGEYRMKLKEYLSVLFLLLGILLIVLGIARGESEVVWEKAVKICLECIGIG